VPDGVLDSGGTPLVGHDAIRDRGRARAASTMAELLLGGIEQHRGRGRVR
jgi:hypothetical protein